MVIYDVLFAGVLVAFGLKRLQFYRINARKTKWLTMENKS